MFARMQERIDEAPSAVRGQIRLVEFAAVQMVLMRASVEALALESGWDNSLASFHGWLTQFPEPSTGSSLGLEHPSAIASVNQQADR